MSLRPAGRRPGSYDRERARLPIWGGCGQDRFETKADLPPRVVVTDIRAGFIKAFLTPIWKGADYFPMCVPKRHDSGMDGARFVSLLTTQVGHSWTETAVRFESGAMLVCPRMEPQTPTCAGCCGAYRRDANDGIFPSAGLVGSTVPRLLTRRNALSGKRLLIQIQFGNCDHDVDEPAFPCREG